MKLKTPSKTTLTEYCLAPWHLRVRWWLASRFSRWCSTFEESGAQSPEQVNPLWRRW
jgi:hypothetical protein